MSTRTLQAVRLYAEAFEDLFAQCCSNPIKNAWGQEVNTTKLNAAHAFASRVLAGQEAPQPAAQQGDGWRDGLWQVAEALGCLPCSFDEMLLKARAAAEDAARWRAFSARAQNGD